MRSKTQHNLRILSVAPSTKGFGFVVVEGEATLIDWGVATAMSEKNARTITKVGRLIDLYSPGVLVLPDAFDRRARRSSRVKALCLELAELATTRKLKVALISKAQIQSSFFAKRQGTKHEIAQVLAARFAPELATSLPARRRPWTSEDHRMDIFCAVALAMVFRLRGFRKMP